MSKTVSKLFLKDGFSRALKAIVWGTVTFLVVYCLPMMLYPRDVFPFDYATPLLQFATIAVFFAVVGQLFSGTVIGCGFGVAKALIVIAYFLAISNGGIFRITLPISGFSVNLMVDISIVLMFVVAVNLINVVKNILSAIVLLTETSDEIDLT
jgi:hypothetical protein